MRHFDAGLQTVLYQVQQVFVQIINTFCTLGTKLFVTPAPMWRGFVVMITLVQKISFSAYEELSPFLPLNPVIMDNNFVVEQGPNWMINRAHEGTGQETDFIYRYEAKSAELSILLVKWFTSYVECVCVKKRCCDFFMFAFLTMSVLFTYPRLSSFFTPSHFQTTG